MRGVVLGWVCSDVNETSFVHGGKGYNIRIGKIFGLDKRVFTVYRSDCVCVLQGSTYRPAADILKTVVGVIEGKEPVGNISVDANGKVAVGVTSGMMK